MKTDDLQKALIRAARTAPADERVPYAFEKRIMARLTEVAQVDLLTLWNRALWRAVAPCVMFTLCITAWVLLTPETPVSAPVAMVDEPPLEFQQVLLAPLDDMGEVW